MPRRNKNKQPLASDINNNAPPRKVPDFETASSMIAKELNEMSVEEREQIYEDVHCVSRVVEEEPEFVSQCLHELQTMIDKIRNKPAYDLSLTQSKEYATSRKFRLMFLRSANFVPKDAARKIVKFFEYKRLYFGDEYLGREIRFTDLSTDDLDCWKSGWAQILPFRDKAGRVVTFNMFQFMPDKDIFNILRAMYYGCMTLVNDEECQKSGAVTVAIGVEDLELSKRNIELVWHISNFPTFSPCKMVTTHFCTKHTGAAHRLFALAYNTWDKEHRVRNRIHVGSQTDWMYALMTFGIPVEYAPLTSSGQLKNKYSRDLINSRRVFEKECLFGNKLIIPTRIYFPHKTDVLSGRGSLAQRYAGNHLFHQITDEHNERYQKEKSRKRKMDIVKEIWCVLKAANVRFLEQTEYQTWDVVQDEDEIYNRIMFRLRKKLTPVLKVEHSSRSDQPSFLNQTGANSNNFDTVDCCNPMGSYKRFRILMRHES